MRRRQPRRPTQRTILLRQSHLRTSESRCARSWIAVRARRGRRFCRTGNASGTTTRGSAAGNSRATALSPGFQHRDVRSRRGESFPRRGEQSALDFLDRCRHGVVFKRAALHRIPVRFRRRTRCGSRKCSTISRYDYPQPNGDKPFSINLDAESAHGSRRIGWSGSV